MAQHGTATFILQGCSINPIGANPSGHAHFPLPCWDDTGTHWDHTGARGCGIPPKEPPDLKQTPPRAAAQNWVPTTLSYSSSVSLSPAVLLKLLVLEEEREMLDRPFSFSLTKGLGGDETLK